jgi:hypothetical protein
VRVARATPPGLWVFGNWKFKIQNSKFKKVNLKRNVLIVFRDPVDGKYQSQQKFTSGTISLLAFPDLAIAVSRLLV